MTAIVATDIISMLSINDGSAGSSLPSTTSESLGGYISTTQIVDSVVDNLFDSINAADAAAGKTTYRCFFKLNNHATDPWRNVVVYIASQLAGGGTIAIGLDPVGVVAKDSASAQATDIADQYTAPTGVTFSNVLSPANALVVGDVDAGSCFAIWVRLVIPSGVPAASLDGGRIRCQGQQ